MSFPVPAKSRGVRVALAPGLAAGLLAAGLLAVITGCGNQAAARVASSSGAPRSSPSALVMAGPRVPDAACQAAVRAQHALEASQVRDKTNVTALGTDFTNFANALTADAGRETNSAAAQDMTNLANDYTALVQSETGNAQLPAMTTIQNDGAAFTRACG